MSTTTTTTVDFEVTDVSGQRSASVRNCPADASVAEVIPSLLEEMSLPPNDVSGNPITHTLRRDRDGTVLHGAETIGDVIATGEKVVLQPNIDAGSGGI